MTPVAQSPRRVFEGGFQMKMRFLFWASIAVSLSGCPDKEATGAPPPKAVAVPAAAPAVAAPAAARAGGACTHADQGTCIEYPSTLSAAEAVDEKKDCEKDQGRWSAESCSTKDLLGTCMNEKEGGGMKIKLYRGAAFSTANEAKKAMCSGPGDQFTTASK